MFAQRFLCPLGRAFQRVVVGDVFYEVHRDLAPSDQLVDVGVVCSFGRFVFVDGFLRSEGDGDWADVSEVKVRGESAGSIRFRMIASGCVLVQMMVHEILETLQRSMGSAAEGIDGT